MRETGSIRAERPGDTPKSALDPTTLTLLVRESLKRLEADPEVRQGLVVALRQLTATETAPWGGLLPWQIQRVRGYLDGRLEGRIPLAAVAEQARLSPSHFSRCFRQSFGVTFVKFVARKRIERAQRLMVTSRANLCHIALACGFADQAHFTRTFSTLTGSTPSQWRRAAIGEVSARSPCRASVRPPAPVARLQSAS